MVALQPSTSWKAKYSMEVKQVFDCLETFPGQGTFPCPTKTIFNHFWTSGVKVLLLFQQLSKILFVRPPIAKDHEIKTRKCSLFPINHNIFFFKKKEINLHISFSPLSFDSAQMVFYYYYYSWLYPN